MSDTYVLVNGNKAEIRLPADVEVTVKVKTNSPHTQKVQLTSKDGSVDRSFTGSGERNTVIGDSRITGQDLYFATFEFAPADGVFMPSRLNSGGPYAIGNYNILVVVAENGDDADYNDTVLEFSWFTPKP
ncbi:fucose-binding lectin II [Kitasatospora sp. NPDC097691]|uniref:fucose-binding lectin II n=1 Tax=Kitasatospora sp. NPDC097691 TaxID=3157231 RepID=UPI00331AD7F7